MRFLDWINQTFILDFDYLENLRERELSRRVIVWKIQNDLATLAVSLGQSNAQIENKVDALFSTFAAEWSIYIFTGASAIIDAIQNDATLPWLDTLASGLTIRQHLINRLS